MRNTKRRPVGVGEMLKLDFLESRSITSKALAAAKENTPEFWFNIQHSVNLWIPETAIKTKPKRSKH